jgi:hypothetical protein
MTTHINYLIHILFDFQVAAAAVVETKNVLTVNRVVISRVIARNNVVAGKLRTPNLRVLTLKFYYS